MKKLILLFILPIAIWVYSAIATPYPYYATWDSSQVYTLDAMIAGAGQVPDHLFHPNMVPLVLYRHVFLPVGKLLGLISVTSIAKLQSLPNPYLSFAETAQYLIALGGLFALVFLSFMYLTLFELLEPYSKSLRGHAAGLLALTITALALVWGCLPYMLIWVRYETVGLALWSVALYATVRAAREPHRSRFVLVAGFFSGGAIMCKVQLAGGVAVLPFLYGFLLDGALPAPRKWMRLGAIALALGVFVLLASVHYSAYAAFTRHELPRVAFDKYLQAKHFVPIAPAVALFFLVAVVGIVKWAHRWPSLTACATRLSWFAAAFSATLLLALLLGTTWQDRTGALYLTYIYSFMFGQLSQGEATGYIKPVVWGNHLTLFAVVTVALVASVVGWLRARNRLSSFQLVAGAVAVAAAVLACVVLLRPTPRKDGMMLDAWLLLGGVVVWRMLLAVFSEKKVLLVGCAAAWIAIGCQVVELSRFHETNYRSGDYDYAIKRWKEFSYGFRGKAYKALMHKAYPTEAAWMTAFGWSKEIPGIKLLFAQSFPGMDLKLGNTRLAIKGGRFGAHGTEKITVVAPELSGALIVPLKNQVARIRARADADFYLLADAAPRSLAGKSLAVHLAFQTEKGQQTKSYLVYVLAPADVTVDPGGSTAAIAIKSP
jgi:hypothetical protein